jgi:hypothetical protein
MTVRDELLAIQAKSADGMLHGRTVVAWARTNKRSALHQEFEWDDARAGHQYRLWQARRLIALEIVADDSTAQVVSLRFDRSRGGGYRAISDVLSSRELSERMLADALADLERVKERYRFVKELCSVWEELDRVKESRKRKAA